MSGYEPTDVSDVLNDIEDAVRYRHTFTLLEKLSRGDALPDEMAERLLAICEDMDDVKRTLEALATTVNDFVRTTWMRAALIKMKKEK